MKLRLGITVILAIILLISAKSIFQKIPKPNYINLGPSVKCQRLPQFSDYPTAQAIGSVVVPIDFKSNERAKAMQVEILAATPSGSNFSGSFMLVETSCGLACQNHAIINSVSGAIAHYGYRTKVGVNFKPDSSLIVFDNTYYDFKAGQLTYLCEK